eukprot:770616_1
MAVIASILLVGLACQVYAENRALTEVSECGVDTYVHGLTWDLDNWTEGVALYTTPDVGQNYNYTITVKVSDPKVNIGEVYLVNTKSKARFTLLSSTAFGERSNWIELLANTQYEIHADVYDPISVGGKFTVKVDCLNLCAPKTVNDFKLGQTASGGYATVQCTESGLWFSEAQSKEISVLCEGTNFKQEDVAKITTCVKSPPCSSNGQTIKAEQTGTFTCPPKQHVQGEDETVTEQPVTCILGGELENEPLPCVLNGAATPDEKVTDPNEKVTDPDEKVTDDTKEIVFTQGEIVGLAIGCTLLVGALVYFGWMLFSVISNGDDEDGDNNQALEVRDEMVRDDVSIKVDEAERKVSFADAELVENQ